MEVQIVPYLLLLVQLVLCEKRQSYDVVIPSSKTSSRSTILSIPMSLLQSNKAKKASSSVEIITVPQSSGSKVEIEEITSVSIPEKAESYRDALIKQEYSGLNYETAASYPTHQTSDGSVLSGMFHKNNPSTDGNWRPIVIPHDSTSGKAYAKYLRTKGTSYDDGSKVQFDDQPYGSSLKANNYNQIENDVRQTVGSYNQDDSSNAYVSSQDVTNQQSTYIDNNRDKTNFQKYTVSYSTGNMGYPTDTSQKEKLNAHTIEEYNNKPASTVDYNGYQLRYKDASETSSYPRDTASQYDNNEPARPAGYSGYQTQQDNDAGYQQHYKDVSGLSPYLRDAASQHDTKAPPTSDGFNGYQMPEYNGVTGTSTYPKDTASQHDTRYSGQSLQPYQQVSVYKPDNNQQLVPQQDSGYQNSNVYFNKPQTIYNNENSHSADLSSHKPPEYESIQQYRTIPQRNPYENANVQVFNSNPSHAQQYTTVHQHPQYEGNKENYPATGQQLPAVEQSRSLSQYPVNNYVMVPSGQHYNHDTNNAQQYATIPQTQNYEPQIPMGMPAEGEYRGTAQSHHAPAGYQEVQGPPYETPSSRHYNRYQQYEGHPRGRPITRPPPQYMASGYEVNTGPRYMTAPLADLQFIRAPYSGVRQVVQQSRPPAHRHPSQNYVTFTTEPVNVSQKPKIDYKVIYLPFHLLKNFLKGRVKIMNEHKK